MKGAGSTTYLLLVSGEDAVQLLGPHVAAVRQHGEVQVHRLGLASVHDAEDVDSPGSDGQGFGQEVPEYLQSTLSRDTGIDKLSGRDAWGRQRSARVGGCELQSLH